MTRKRAFESSFVPMIFFDQGKREVNAGGGTRRCLDRARYLRDTEELLLFDHFKKHSPD
jgi:hypothetical protein